MGGQVLAIGFLCLCLGCVVVCQSTCFDSEPGKQLNATATKQFITSPGFPNNYTNNLRCYWTISDTDACGLIRFDVIFANLEWGPDSVRLIYDSSYMYKVIRTSPVHVIPSKEVMVRFFTDQSIVGQGFNMSYVAEDCICVNTSGIDVVAASTTQYITSPGFPYSYPHDIRCKWNITLSATCSLLRMEVFFIGIADGSDNLTFSFDEGHLNLLSNLVYHIPSKHSVLGFQSDSSTSGKGFNISYQAVDLRVTTRSPVFRCQDSQLLAEEQSKYIHWSNNLDYSMDTSCEWMIFVAEPCMVSSKGTSRILTVVVDELRTNGSTTVAIFHAPSLEHKKIDISQDSNLLGRPLYFHVPIEEFILITFRSEGSELKISYKTSPEDEPHQQTVWITSTAAVGGVFVISVIVHLVVCILRRRKIGHRLPDRSIEMSTTQQKTETRPYVKMDQLDNAIRRQGETTTADEIYEAVDDEQVAVNKNELRDYMDMSGSKREQVVEIYENQGNVARGNTSRVGIDQNDGEGDGEDYEEIRDYINASLYNKRQ